MGPIKLLPVVLTVVMVLTLSFMMLSPAVAVKGSYLGKNGQVAFTAEDLDPQQSDSEIFVMNNDGTDARQLTHNEVSDNDPCWSPDGTKIAFSSGGQIWVMNSDGSNLQGPLTTPGEDQYDDEPAWSPDGLKIAFIRNYMGYNQQRLYVMGADGSNPTPLTDENDVYDPHWSLDGTVIAVGIGENLALVNPTPPGSIIAQTDWDHEMTAETLSWSPDNSKIAFSLSAWSDGHSEIYWVKGDLTGTPTQLTTNVDSSSWDPDWSPDGTKILFNRGTTSVWVMNANDGSEAHDLTPTMVDAGDPDWQRLPAAPVGGFIEPVNTLAIVAPYLALLGLVAVLVARKKTVS